MQSLFEIAANFTAMLRSKQFAAAGEAYWADHVISTEPYDLPSGFPAKVSGIAATRNKWNARFDGARIDEISIDGPFVTGNQFALFIDMMIVSPAGGAARPFTQIAVYTICGGHISEERHFYD